MEDTSKKTEKTSRSKNFTDSEKFLLIEIIKERNLLDVIQLKKNDAISMTSKVTAWNEILELFSAQNANSRTMKQLQVLWRDLKSRAKDKFTKIKQERLKTGGGKFNIEIDAISQAMIDLLPQHQLEPLSGVNDSDLIMHEISVSELNIDSCAASDSNAENVTPNAPPPKRRRVRPTDGDILAAKLIAIKELTQQQREQHDLKMDILRTIKKNLQPGIGAIDRQVQTDTLLLLDVLNCPL